MKRKILAMAVLGSLVLASSAGAIKVRLGDLILTANGGLTPRTLPKNEDAPITVYGGGKVSTVSGELPPILDTIEIEFDKHGHLDTAGLPVCSSAKLQATTVAAARKACSGAIVGKGTGSAIVAFPEQAPIPISSPLTLFNGPKKHGNDTVFAHAYTTVPVATTFIVPVEIEKIHKGVYGYRVEAQIPKIAGGAGHPISGSMRVGKKWTHKGKKLSYVNARCQTGRLQARFKATFKDSTSLQGALLTTCKVRK